MYSFLAAAPWFSSTKSCKNPVNMQLFGVQKKFAKSIGFATSLNCLKSGFSIFNIVKKFQKIKYIYMYIA